jgi:predicted nucleotidyltransferase
MDETIRKVAQDIVSACGQDLAVVLIGSASRGKRTEQSDIDMLVVGKEHPVLPFRFTGFHIQAISQEDFLINLRSGEDFESWCVRLGIPLHDSGIWAQILESPYAGQWPDWRTKVVHGARRLFLANSLLQTGDTDAAAEELLYVLCHVARGLLLKGGVFPLSRPELAEQVGALGYPKLAGLHEQLRTTSTSRHTLAIGVGYSKKLLCHLDRLVYGRCSKEYRAKRKAKTNRPLPKRG